MAKIIAYASSTKPNHLWSAAQYNSALPKNRADVDIPLVALSSVQELLNLAFQYRDDLRHPPAPDSRERRLAAIEAAIAKATA